MASIARKLIIHLPPKAKARPRVTQRGTYMPRDYQVWRESFMREVLGQHGEPMTGAFGIVIEFHTRTGGMRPDLDNAAGAVLDALQDAGIIANDRDCKALRARVTQAKQAAIYITIEAL